MDKQPPLWEEALRAVSNGQQLTASQWDALSADERNMIETLRQQALTVDAVAFADRIDEDKAWAGLSDNIRRSSPARSISMRFMRYAAVFAGVIVLGGAAVFLLRKASAPQPVVAGTYITPPANHKRAMLVLEDGRQVELDKSAASRIRQGQAEIVNVDTSLLRYTAGAGTIGQAGYNTLIVPRGGEYKIQLADGTEVWLNAETQLRYPAHFGGLDKREVYLEAGEAYFKVAPNARQPFMVRAGGMDVQVLGTEFNVNTYTKEYATTLVNGSVQVSAGAGVAGTLLRPDQQAVYADGGFTRKDVDIEPYVAWREGQMIFVETSLEEVMSSVGRQYDFRIEFTLPSLKERKFGGRLRRTQHIEDVLAVIGKVGGVQFSIKGKTIFVGEALITK